MKNEIIGFRIHKIDPSKVYITLPQQEAIAFSESGQSFNVNYIINFTNLEDKNDR